MQKTISAAVYVREAVKRATIPALAAVLRARGARVELLNSGRAMFVNFTNRPTEPGLNPENLANAKAIGAFTQYLHPFLRETRPVRLGLPNDHFETVVVLPADEERRDWTVRPARGKGGPPWNVVRLPIRHGEKLDATERAELSALVTGWRQDWCKDQVEGFADAALKFQGEDLAFRLSDTDQKLTLPWIDLYLRLRDSRFGKIVEYVEFVGEPSCMGS